MIGHPDETEASLRIGPRLWLPCARTGMLAWRDRVFLVYGLLLTVVEIGYGLFGQEVFFIMKQDPLRFASLAMGVVGLIFSLFAMFRVSRK